MKQDVRAAKSVASVTSNGFTFEMETNSRYTEILELAKQMDKLGIPYELKPCYDGWELLYPNAANVVAGGQTLKLTDEIHIVKQDGVWDEYVEQIVPLDVTLTFHDAANDNWLFTVADTDGLTAGQWYTADITVDGAARTVLLEYCEGAGFYIYGHCFGATPSTQSAPTSSVLIAADTVLKPVSLPPNAANVVMDAVSHVLVNDSRNAIEVLGIGEYHPPVYENQTAAEAIRFFYVHYKMNRREVDRLLPPRPIKAEFYDIETQEYVSKEQLRQEFKEAKAADVRDEHGHKFLSFPQWLNNCMTYNNGTLIHVTA